MKSTDLWWKRKPRTTIPQSYMEC